MNVYELSEKEVCSIVLKSAKKYEIEVDRIAFGISGSCFVVIHTKSVDDVKLCKYLSELNDIFLGTIDENGNFLDTEANIFARGYDGAIVLGSTSMEEYKRYMLAAAQTAIKTIYKDGVLKLKEGFE